MSDSSILKRTEEYLVFDEVVAEQLVEQIKTESVGEGYEVVAYSINKKTKKTIEYYIVRIVKEYQKEKDLVVE